MVYDYDVIFIGAGHGAFHGAFMLVAAGKKVALIERNRFGGTCTTYGCDPKILLDAPFEIAEQAQRYENKGLDGHLSLNWNDLMNYKNQVINAISPSSQAFAQSLGVDFIKKTAKLVDEHTVEADGQNYTAENIVIATGQRANVLDVKGKEFLHNSTDMMFKDDFPKRITFIGAGIISLEFASMAMHLGSEVHVVEFTDRALRQYNGEYVDRVVTKMKDSGVQFHFNEAVCEVEKNGDEYIVKTESGLEIATDYVLDATGRISNVENLGLEELGIKTDKGGIIVDDHMRTAIKNIYASGDVVSKKIAKLTPTAAFESEYIARQILGNEGPIKYPVVPSLVYTLPRIAQVGVTIDEAKANPDKYSIAKYNYGERMLFQQKNEKDAELTVILDENKHLVGADIYGEQAADLINFLMFTIEKQLTGKDLENMIFAFPATTWALFYVFLQGILAK